MEQQIEKLNQARTNFLEAYLELIIERDFYGEVGNVIDLSFPLRRNGATTWMTEMLKKYPNSLALVRNRYELAILRDKHPDLPFYLLNEELKGIDLTDKIIFLDKDRVLKDQPLLYTGLLLVKI